MQFIIGLAVGLFFMFLLLFPPLRALHSRWRPVGDLRVDRSDPMDQPYLFLEFDAGTDVNTVIHSKHVVLRVKCEDFLPHE